MAMTEMWHGMVPQWAARICKTRSAAPPGLKYSMSVGSELLYNASGHVIFEMLTN